MIKKYKKGKVLEVKYFVSSEKDVIASYGIVYEITDLRLVLVHNFSGTDRKPIDITKIPLKNILRSREVVPKEFNLV